MKKLATGYTLIEILVALSVFAILSAMTTYAMYNAFTTRERVNVQANRLNALQLGITLISHDIEQIVKPAKAATDEEPSSDFIGESRRLEFMRGGVVNPNGDDRRSTLQRIAYLCMKDQLIRRSWDRLNPGSQDNYQDKTLFNHLEKCHFAYLNKNHDTLSTWGDPSTQKDGNIKPEIIPIAIEFSLTLDQLGNMTLLFALPGGLYE